MVSNEKKHAVIIGAGPAGLTAATELLKLKEYSVSVLERDNIIGGLARTTTLSMGRRAFLEQPIEGIRCAAHRPPRVSI